MSTHGEPPDALSALPTERLCGDIFEQWRASCIAARRGRDRPPVEVLKELTDAEDANTHLRALKQLLGRLSGLDREEKLHAMAALAVLIDAPDPRVRARAVLGLARLNLRGPPLTWAMLRALADVDPDVRSTALAAVARDPQLIGPGSLAVQLVRGMGDISPTVRRTAVRGASRAGPFVLGRISDDKRDALYRQLFATLDDRDSALARHAANALFAIIRQGLLVAADVVAFLDARPVTPGSAVLVCELLDAASERFLLRAATTPGACRLALRTLARSGPAALARGLRRLRAAHHVVFGNVTVEWGARSTAERHVWEQALGLVLGQLTPVRSAG